jgi:two-component system phosphate regulon sensor histidine kinase PhoR
MVSGMRPLEPSERAAFAVMAQAMNAPVIALDSQARVLVANSQARALMPALRENVLLPMVLRAPDVIDAIARVAGGAEAQQVAWSERFPHELLFDVRVAPANLSGALVIVLSFLDLSEPRRLERMRSDFIANASHELRTPLASLLGFVETLQGPARDDPAAHAQFLPIMADQARRMSRLIDDLLSLSRIEQTQHVRPSARVDMADILRRSMDELSPLAQEERAVVNINAPQNAWVVGDPDELIRVVENLIENAIKYGAKPGVSAHVTIDLALGDHDVVLSVQDEGPGIEPEHLPRLTERFYRADAKSSRAKGGTGLGLAIVKHIVVRHSGRLVIESEPGRGAKFAVRIPKHQNGA